MMILRSSSASPFGRKVRIFAHVVGLADRIEIEDTDANNVSGSLVTQNPLGKIPVLVLDDGETLYDSRVICEYLDSLHAGAKLYPEGPDHWPALRLQALGDGILDAAILVVYEKRLRPEEMWFNDWIERQQGKIDRALTALESGPPMLPKSPGIGHITLACALGYLDLRFDGRWRDNRPNLVSWLEAFDNAVPAFGQTAPTG